MELARKLLTALFPARCLLCQQTIEDRSSAIEVDICDSCYQALPCNRRHCTRCALPLPEDLPDDVMCGRCIKQSPAFDYCHSLFRYEVDIIRLVHQLKFSDLLTSARSIGEMLSLASAALFTEYGRPDCLLPVPLHRQRLRSRGYNQSIEIARQLAKKEDIPIDIGTVVRQRSTAAQTGLDAKSRQKNIRGAFRLNKVITHKHVLIIDDVVTTGATVSELASLLKKNKVETVGVLSFARAPIKS